MDLTNTTSTAFAHGDSTRRPPSVPVAAFRGKRALPADEGGGWSMQPTDCQISGAAMRRNIPLVSIEISDGKLATAFMGGLRGDALPGRATATFSWIPWLRRAELRSAFSRVAPSSRPSARRCAKSATTRWRCVSSRPATRRLKLDHATGQGRLRRCRGHLQGGRMSTLRQKNTPNFCRPRPLYERVYCARGRQDAGLSSGATSSTPNPAATIDVHLMGKPRQVFRAGRWSTRRQLAAASVCGTAPRRYGSVGERDVRDATTGIRPSRDRRRSRRHRQQAHH